MTASTKNSLIRVALLGLNILMIGSIAFSSRQKRLEKLPEPEAKVEETAAQKTGIKRIFRKKEDGAQLSGESITTSAIIGDATEQRLSDGSRLKVMKDGYGSTTVTRYFAGHPRLRMVMVQTGSQDKQRIFVYGRNGKVKGVPQVIAKKILVATADEIADAAKIYSGISEKEARRARVANARADIKAANEKREREQKELERANRPQPVSEDTSIAPENDQPAEEPISEK
jgi:hypothetical protein